MHAYACRLCASPSVMPFHTDRMREYHQCSQCHLVFVPDRFVLSNADEKALYDLHENVPGDAGYEKFLSRAAKPLADFFPPNAHSEAMQGQRRGLDFGCGRVQVLAHMLSTAPYNFSMDAYDLYYFPENRHFLEREGHYDFITATEVLEHLQDPFSVLRTLWRCIRIGGVLVIMTKRVHGTVDSFCNWHYIRDPTHITFFHQDSFQWLADFLPSEGEACEARFVSADVVLLIKQQNKEI
ncbi:conserved hypothetical protein [Leishmania braziliensis MHOM/BR/75/M2904]|uniref:Methyltransferase type 11 domain-containing protein n=1 Tax=Leishmania braziliensis TaxID=5660 RepID=A4H6B4_LEIBR|nr:conserved hypothetical protein [Leishmania braziliensis MHOM/BR/75/M2904]CAJ2467952.1 unnamed protein product [Leishmania braziliensis]CAM37338.1 conserved hypothetical protein [Leishmania braziliensis MHOM/BR/75/M2904]